MRLSAKSKTVGGVAAAVIALSSSFIAPWEGKRNYAYIPIPGDVPTICYGSTSGVKMGDYKTDAECLALFQKEVGEFYAKIEHCMTNKAIPVSVQASMLELAYNVGTGAACKSTMFKLANAGKYRAACEELGKWVKAGGRVVNGLVTRRNASKAMCVRDL